MTESKTEQAASEKTPTTCEPAELPGSQITNLRLHQEIRRLRAELGEIRERSIASSEEDMGEIYAKMADVMRDIDAIGKTRRNTQGSGYNFRGIDDLYNEVHGHLAKHGVFTVPTVLEDRSEERTSQKGAHLIYRILKVRYRFFTEDGSYVDAVMVGEAMDSGDKASNKAMAAAHKYALLQVFCIPTEELKDSEEDTYEVAPPDVEYDGSRDLKKALCQAASDAGVPKERWASVHEKALGQMMSTLPQTIAAVKKELTYDAAQ